jgi:hypothetical protein
MPQFLSRPFVTSVVCALGLGAIHYLVQLTTIVVLFSAGMYRFDTGAAPTLFEQVLGLFNTLWMLPLALPLSGWLPFGMTNGLAGHLLLMTNGLCWGILLVLGGRWYVHRAR